MLSKTQLRAIEILDASRDECDDQDCSDCLSQLRSAIADGADPAAAVSWICENADDASQSFLHVVLNRIESAASED